MANWTRAGSQGDFPPLRPQPPTPLSVLASVACSRHRVEEFFEDAKSYLGMAQYETRSWVGWHHRMTFWWAWRICS
jgi:hypothetical protein